MLRSDDLRFFARVSAEASLAAAARELNVTPSAVTQRLAALEAELGVKLTHRTNRGIILTDEGLLLQERAATILADLEELRAELSDRRTTVEGHLRVLAPFGFGRAFVAPLCSRFARLYPQVEISLDLAEALGRHPVRAWDVAIHVGLLSDSSLTRIRITPHRRLLVASPAYLDRAGRPTVPEDLAGHACLLIRENAEDSGLWRFQGPDGDTTIRVPSTLSSNDGEVVRGWALDGLGIALRSEWSIARDVATGRLIELMPDWPAPATDVVALIGPANARTARVRCFLDMLSAELRDRPWLSAGLPIADSHSSDSGFDDATGTAS